jgi:hypothetical protein
MRSPVMAIIVHIVASINIVTSGIVESESSYIKIL